jgi:hypothetical protein
MILVTTIRPCLRVGWHTYNNRLIQSKLQIEEPLKEVSKAKDFLESIVPFAFLTPDELNYFEMGDSHFGGGGAGGSDDKESDRDYEEDDNKATE